MSGFFDSELVRESLTELNDMQEKIFEDMLMLPFLSSEKKREHIEMMKEFLEKQKVFIFRLSLSDDPKAIEMKETIMKSAKMFGLNDGDNLNVFFDRLEETLNNLEDTLDK